MAPVAFVLDVDGRPKEVQAKSATNQLFADAAVACVSQRRFTSATVGGVAVAIKMDVPVVFQLNRAR